MDILVIGGGRAGARHRKKTEGKSRRRDDLCTARGNGGMTADAVCVPEIGTKDISAQVEFAKAHQIGFAVVAPDDPLVLGRGGCAGRCRYSLLRPRSKGCRY